MSLEIVAMLWMHSEYVCPYKWLDRQDVLAVGVISSHIKRGMIRIGHLAYFLKQWCKILGKRLYHIFWTAVVSVAFGNIFSVQLF